MKNFKEIFRGMKIKLKLIFIFSIVIAYTFVVLIFFGYGSYRNLTLNKSVNYAKKNAEELSMLLQDKIDNINSFTRTILYDNRIYTFNKEIILSKQDPYFQITFASDVENYLRSILFSKDELLSVGFKFANKSAPFLVSRIYTDNDEVLADINKIYAAAKTGKGKPVWLVSNQKGEGEVEGQGEGESRIYVAKMVYDINTLKELGIYIFRINPDSIFNIMKNVSANIEQNMYVFDNHNRPLFEFTCFKPNLKNFQEQLINLKNSNDFVKIKTKDDTIYANSSYITPENFKMIICISSTKTLKEVNELSRFLFFLFLMTIPILLILANYFQKDLLKPLNLLVSKMKKVENGEIGATIDSKRGDEIGYVFKTFNKMSEQIKVLIDSVYREQIALKDEEIKALQAQINPHFLYNTLEAINWKARIHGVSEISDMVSALSYIMEANMNRNNERFVSVEREIEYIDNYRFIIEKRFNQKLKFKIDAPKYLLEYKIPKLIILPVIENSVYHGLETKKGEGTIELVISIVDNDLIITVIDDGLGIEEKNLERIKNYLDIDINDIDDNEKKAITNIGLINVHKRIRLLYGNDYGISVASKLNEGTCVIIKLPSIKY
jgi:two-component system, sensor histidine kinase YesM